MMIDQTGGLSSTIQREQLYRNNSTTQTSQRETDSGQDAKLQSSQSGDTVSLSAQAVAQYKNVPPTSAASELQESPASETSSEDAQEPKRAGRIDIKV